MRKTSLKLLIPMKTLFVLLPLLAGLLISPSGAQTVPPTTSIPLSGGTLQGLAGTAAAVTYTVLGVELSDGTPDFHILAQGQLASSNATIYTSPSRTRTFVTQITLANATTTAVSGIILSVNGSTAGTYLLPGITLAAQSTATFSEGRWNLFDATPALAPGGCSSKIAASAAIVNAQAQVTSCTIPANRMAAGTTYRVTAAGRITTAGSPGNDVFKVRVGPTTLTGNVAATLTAAATASITNQTFYLEFLVTVRTIGASGTVVGQGIVWSADASTGAFTVPNLIGITTVAVAVDTTVANLVELTLITGASDSSATFQNAAIEVVKI